VRLFGAILAVLLAVAATFLAWVRSEPDRRLAAFEQQHVRIEPFDVVFQDLECGRRCDLIREITQSPLTHTGIVLEEHGQRMVWEAYGPVGPVPLAEWLDRTHGSIAVYRLDPRLLKHSDAIAREVRAMRGFPYDGDYQWDDERIYCSELIHKAVLRATGVALAPPRTFTFGVNRADIAQLTHGHLTESTFIVAPVDLAQSHLLIRRGGDLPADEVASRL
jgi:hypothetical protein